MIRKNGKDITSIYQGERAIAAIYKGVDLVGQLANSCFGSGIWMRDKKGSNTDIWRNN